MRAADLPVPTSIVLDPVPQLDGWPIRPVIALEQKPLPPYTWDDGRVWDDPTPLVWDAPSTRPLYTDATCAFTGMEIDAGQPDDAGLFPATRAVVQLDNRTGAWSRYNADGTPADYGTPGMKLSIWATDRAAGNWWLFNGFIARYDQRADDTIELEAFDVFSDLAQPIGRYTPGAAADLPGARQQAILAAAGRPAIARRLAAGANRLTAQVTDQSPLEELQTVAASDGGIIYVDADGTLVSYDRTWRAGRPDQTTIPTVSDNVCAAPVVVWDAIISTVDEHLAAAVVLENVAHLRSVAGTIGGYTITDTDQQWTTQTEGDVLAAQLLAAQSAARLRLEEATLYLADPRQPQLWQAVDWRRFDRVRFVHDQKVAPGGTTRIELQLLLNSLTHEITPANWTVTFSTGRAVDYSVANLWDWTYFTWDDPNPANVWTF